jgi:hypothetical protein
MYKNFSSLLSGFGNLLACLFPFFHFRIMSMILFKPKNFSDLVFTCILGSQLTSPFLSHDFDVLRLYFLCLVLVLPPLVFYIPRSSSFNS